MNTCLLIVDLQNDYFTGGEMELVDIEKAAVNAQLLLNKFREECLPVIHIQHIAARPGATFFLPGTHGAEINELVAPKDGEIKVEKNFPNSFRDTPLLEILTHQKTKTLIICGAMSHMCIDATTRAAFDLGFNCVVVEDACTTRDLLFNGTTIKASDVHASFMAALSAPYATVISAKGFIQSRA